MKRTIKSLINHKKTNLLFLEDKSYSKVYKKIWIKIIMENYLLNLKLHTL